MEKSTKLKNKIKKLNWNVFYLDFNAKKIVQFNVFNHYSFSLSLEEYTKNHKKELKKENLTEKERKELIEKYKKEIHNDLMYYFWSKYEWEIGITEPFEDHIVKQDREYPWEKVDVYDQVNMNFDIFFDYIYKNLIEN